MSDAASSAIAPSTLLLDDGLGRGSCTCSTSCREIVGWFRESIGRSRRFNVAAVPLTPSELIALPTAAKRVGVYAMAAIDLDAYPNVDAVMAAARSRTKRRGAVNYQVARALWNGYGVREFQPGKYIQDMVAIHRSKAFRDRKPLEGAFQLADTDALAKVIASTAASSCPVHNQYYWGVFQKVTEGATNDRLAGYVCVTRLGNTLIYRRGMGHGDHLRNGIMYLLHYELMALLVTARPAGARYLTDGPYARRPFDPASHWKRLALFEPHYLFYADDHCVRIPAAPSMPELAEGLLAIKQTLDEPWPQAVVTAEQFGVSHEWLGILHRTQIVEAVRAPGLMMNVLRSGPHPPLDVLHPLASKLFPAEVLDGIGSALVQLRSDGRGLDTLLPLSERGMQQVQVIHVLSAELNALADTYPPAWTYKTHMDDSESYGADLWIVELDRPESMTKILKAWTDGHSRRLLISVTETDFLASDCLTRTPQEVAARFSEIAGSDLACRGIYLRHSAPDETHWVWIEKSV